MTNENTVTIPLEEYFELRKQSEMNTYLMGEFRRYDERFNRYDDMLFRLEDEIRGLKHGK
jgi:hypothetical protein